MRPPPGQQNVKMPRRPAKSREHARWNNPRCRARRINRRFLRQIGRRRDSRRAPARPTRRLKNRGRALNVQPRCHDQNMWERSSLPISHIRRERPSTPSAHMARPVRLSPRTGLFFSASDFPTCVAGSTRGKAAMLVRSLTKTPHDYGLSGRKAVLLLDKSTLFHKLFMSRLN